MNFMRTATAICGTLTFYSYVRSCPLFGIIPHFVVTVRMHNTLLLLLYPDLGFLFKILSLVENTSKKVFQQLCTIRRRCTETK